ncbi:MAG: peptide chain release factor N(5)-glutamine methyltransferase [Holosporales bacterium]|jgi:release factor glutamine methyltransferase|nr:peptide chain release factor N(5)-glutamine methyltransferase [Holosporales bacterium]
MLWRSLAQALGNAGIERPWKELRLLAEHVTKIPYVDIALAVPTLSDDQWQMLQALVQRRVTREPLTKIIGRANFWKHEFVTTRDTLDPRPESELIIEVVLLLHTDKSAPVTFLDLGTGTGCLLLSCLSEYPHATGIGVDISKAALDVASKNSANLNLTQRAQFQLSDWTKSVDGVFDVILCNPPYISDGDDIAPNGNLDPEALYDPHVALFAGLDGLNAYRNIFGRLREHVHLDVSKKFHSIILFEIGAGQNNTVSKIAEEHGFALLRTFLDYQGIPRVLAFYYVF